MGRSWRTCNRWVPYLPLRDRRGVGGADDSGGQIIKDCCHYVEHAKRKTVTVTDVGYPAAVMD